MVNIEYLRTKLQKGVYLTLKEKREFIRWAINCGIDNDGIINAFNKYDLNKVQFEFTLNNMRSDLT